MKACRSSNVDWRGEARIVWISRELDLKAALPMYDSVCHPHHLKTSFCVLSKYLSLQLSVQQPIETGHLASPARSTAHYQGDSVNPLHVTYIAVECGLFASFWRAERLNPGQCWRLMKLPQTHMGILNIWLGCVLLCRPSQHSLRQSGVRFLSISRFMSSQASKFCSVGSKSGRRL